MIVILHGENTSKSRDIILQLKNKLDIKIPDENLALLRKELDVTDTTPNELKEAVNSFGLFSDPPFIILDISNAGRKSMKDYIEVLKDINPEATVVIYSTKELSKTNAFIKNKKELNAKVLEQRVIVSSNIFSFLDALWSKNQLKSYQEYKKLLLDNEEPFHIFSMIQYGLRTLALAKFESSEFSKNAPFVKQKTERQLSNFTKEDIKGLYSTIYEMDKKIKTGKLSIEHCIPLIIEKVLT